MRRQKYSCSDLGSEIEAITAARERTADTLFSDLESVASAIEGSELNTTQDNFVPTAKCIQDAKERQLVTRSTVLCMPSPPRVGNEDTLSCSTVSKQYLSKCTTSRSMSLLVMPMRQHTNINKKTGVPRSVQFGRDATWGQHGTFI